jgi:hypothetical protein
MEAHKIDSKGHLLDGLSPDAAEGIASFKEKRKPRFAMRAQQRHAAVLPVVARAPFK